MTFAVPMNLDAERDLLGVLLCYPARIADVEGIVQAIDFSDTRHQLLFAAIGGLVRQAAVVTAPAVFERVKSQDDFTSLRGIEYLNILGERAPLSLPVQGLAKVVADISLRRRAWLIGQDIMREASFGTTPGEQVVAMGEGALGEALRGAGIGDAWQDGEALHKANMATLSGGAVNYVLTGLRRFDVLVGGLQRNRMNVIGARPKMGKTALATIIGLRVAMRGQGVGMFSLEMGAEELAMRAACTLAFRQGYRDNPMYFLAAKGELSLDAREDMAEASARLRDLPFVFDDRPGLKPSQIVPAVKRQLRRWERAGIEPGLIIVDHLTIVAPDHRTGNKVADVAEVSGALRDLFKEAGVTGLVLCQLSRESVRRGVTDPRPQLSDLRWSGEIEQDAAQVSFLHRPAYYLREPLKGEDDYDMKLIEFEEKRDRWRDRCLLLVEANRMGPAQVEIEYGLSLGCNAMWEIEE